MIFLTPQEIVWAKLAHPDLFRALAAKQSYRNVLGLVKVDLGVYDNLGSMRLYDWPTGFGNIGIAFCDDYKTAHDIRDGAGATWVCVSTRSGGDWGIYLGDIPMRDRFIANDYPFDNAYMKWWSHS